MQTTDKGTRPTLTRQSEADLVRRIQALDDAVCTDLTRSFGAAIHGYAASRLGGDVEAAEDIVMETLADGIRNIRRYKPDQSSLSAWLYGIARRHIHTELRKRQRAKSVPAWAQVPIVDQEVVPAPEGASEWSHMVECPGLADNPTGLSAVSHPYLTATGMFLLLHLHRFPDTR